MPPTDACLVPKIKQFNTKATAAMHGYKSVLTQSIIKVKHNAMTITTTFARQKPTFSLKGRSRRTASTGFGIALRSSRSNTSTNRASSGTPSLLPYQLNKSNVEIFKRLLKTIYLITSTNYQILIILLQLLQLYFSLVLNLNECTFQLP